MRMNCRLRFVLAASMLWGALHTGWVWGADENIESDPLLLVDTLVGSAPYAGATFPGAARPFSLMRLGPDTTNPSTAGYNPAEPILGFSHTHMSGAGGVGYYGNIRVTPQAGPLSVVDVASPKREERGEPGYYTVLLDRSNVRAELTCTSRVGFHRYTFAGGATPRILIDVAAAVGSKSQAKYRSYCTAVHAEFVSDRSIEGHGSFIADFAKVPYDVYFVAELDRTPILRGVWRGNEIKMGSALLDSKKEESAGMIAEFDPADSRPLEMRVGISFSSLENARQSVAETQGQSFDQTKAAAQKQWRSDLTQIQVTGGTITRRKQFYTALYQTALMPTEVTGDNPKWPSKEPHFTDLHSIWDTFRTTYPLFTLIRPQVQRDIVRCLLDIYVQKGWLPDYWRLSRYNVVQGGTNADVVIADAIAKNLGGFDQDLAYKAVRKNATVAAPGKQYPQFGRLAPYFDLGYIPGTNLDPKGTAEYTNATSATLEYAYDDYCAATVAAAQGHADDAELFRNRSLGVYKLFNPDSKFFWSKNAAGDWLPGFRADLNGPQPHGWNTPFYEATPWVYRFYVPHDVQGLINHIGGDAAFVAALDEYFDGRYHDPGNEPSFLTPWLYTYAGRPDKTADRVGAILADDYHLAASAYAGDDDSGAMSSWFVFAAMGFYPNAGQDVYLLSTPLFDKAIVKLGSSGKRLVMSAPNLSSHNKYIQSVTLNGKKWDQAWFRHGDVMNGAEIVLRMGSIPSGWGKAVRPPSLSPAP